MSKGGSTWQDLVPCEAPVDHPLITSLSKWKLYSYFLTCEEFTTTEDNDYTDEELDGVLIKDLKVYFNKYFILTY